MAFTPSSFVRKPTFCEKAFLFTYNNPHHSHLTNQTINEKSDSKETALNVLL